MNFQHKDFTYESMAFHTFLDHCTAGKHLYLRSLSTTSPTSKPANFETDFSEISSDFHLPSQLKAITNPESFHSSPLRISSMVNMWLHFDVMANFLFQIRGSKRLILFPPSDIKHLDFPPGATTSKLDISPETQKFPPYTNPVLVTLSPGDALYIPPLWSHCACPTSTSLAQPQETKTASVSTSPDQISSADTSSQAIDPTTISINIFFRTLHASHHSAGADVYGNRDLAAYADARRDIDRLTQRFLRSFDSDSHEPDFTATIPGDNEVRLIDKGSANTNGSNPPTLMSNGLDVGAPITESQMYTPAKLKVEANGVTSSYPNADTDTLTGLSSLNLSPTISKQVVKAYLERLAFELLKKAAEI